MNGVSELIERHSPALKQVFHHVFPTSVQAVGRKFLVLPCSSQSFLYLYRVRKVPDLLEFIYADDYPYIFFVAILSGRDRISSEDISFGLILREKEYPAVGSGLIDI